MSALISGFVATLIIVACFGAVVGVFFATVYWVGRLLGVVW